MNMNKLCESIRETKDNELKVELLGTMKETI